MFDLVFIRSTIFINCACRMVERRGVNDVEINLFINDEGESMDCNHIYDFWILGNSSFYTITLWFIRTARTISPPLGSSSSHLKGN